MTSRVPPQCVFCIHWNAPTSDGQTCGAFPNGIPDDIWWNRADHRKSYRGDSGVRWEPVAAGEYPGEAK